MDKEDDTLFPLFLKLGGRRILLVGGGPAATVKARALGATRARVTIVSPELTFELTALANAQAWTILGREFKAADLDETWLVIAAAPPAVNREVAAAAEDRRIFVLAVDDPTSASAYGAGVVRRDGVTLAISTAGRAPALAGLLREGLDALLPEDLAVWSTEARRLRMAWRAEATAMAERRPRLLLALNQLYNVPGVDRG